MAEFQTKGAFLAHLHCIVFKQRHYQDRTFSILNIRFCQELIDGVEIKFVRSRVVTLDFITSVVSGYI